MPDRFDRPVVGGDLGRRRDHCLALLFEPPFDKPNRDPGYIKGYSPGIRESGGQDTHAATGPAQAFAMPGDGDRAGEILAMLNPIRHGDTAAAISRCKVEPDVICADVYSQAGDATLRIDPYIARDWPRFGIVFFHGLTTYDIVVDNPDGVCRVVAVRLDDPALPASAHIVLVDDVATHRLHISFGSTS